MFHESAWKARMTRRHARHDASYDDFLVVLDQLPFSCDKCLDLLANWHHMISVSITESIRKHRLSPRATNSQLVQLCHFWANMFGGVVLHAKSNLSLWRQWRWSTTTPTANEYSKKHRHTIKHSTSSAACCLDLCHAWAKDGIVSSTGGSRTRVYECLVKQDVHVH
jgi:hypothetical protein